jgi:ATP/maltotriose-dependent transcriptional regulator MalT
VISSRPPRHTTYRGALALASLPGLGALAALPPDPGPEERAAVLLALLRTLPASARGPLLSALSEAYRAPGLARQERDAALALCCLLLGGALLRLSAGREVDAGALLTAVAQAAVRGRRLWWAAQDAARAERRDRPGPLGGDIPETGEAPDLDTALDQRAALAVLSERDRLVLTLAADGATDAEIGEALGVAPDAARKGLSRARARLKK